MSRYSFDGADGHRWYVGWDTATESYFAAREPLDVAPYDPDVHGPSEAAYEDSFFSAVAGGEVHEQLLTPEALQERLPEGTVIPPNLLENLAQDLHPATNTDLVQQTGARYGLAPSAPTSHTADTRPPVGALDPQLGLGARRYASTRGARRSAEQPGLRLIRGGRQPGRVRDDPGYGR
jgi:hypothetical protein